MTRLFTLLAFLAAVTLPARAETEEIVAGLSQNVVSITATFVGSEILIFGAIKREAPAPEGELGVAVVVEGPSHPITVRRKDRRMGIWVNTDSVEVQRA
ncbi:MAG: TIGR02186 family protein, partial [Maritimibacter sp.]|nr:TIGR02186 family protein [Maritimibacter sp.]